MTYIEKNLVTGEQVTFSAKPHWRIFILPGFWLWIGLCAVSFSLLTNGGLSIGTLLAWLVFLIGLRGLVAAAISYTTTEFGVTNKRVIAKTGLLRQRSLELMLRQVEAVSVNQGVWGRLLGYGDVVVTGSGGTWETFPNIADPLTLRRRVNNQIAAGS